MCSHSQFNFFDEHPIDERLLLRMRAGERRMAMELFVLCSGVMSCEATEDLKGAAPTEHRRLVYSEWVFREATENQLSQTRPSSVSLSHHSLSFRTVNWFADCLSERLPGMLASASPFTIILSVFLSFRVAGNQATEEQCERGPQLRATACAVQAHHIRHLSIRQQAHATNN